MNMGILFGLLFMGLLAVVLVYVRLRVYISRKYVPDAHVWLKAMCDDFTTVAQIEHAMERLTGHRPFWFLRNRDLAELEWQNLIESETFEYMPKCFVRRYCLTQGGIFTLVWYGPQQGKYTQAQVKALRQ